MDISKTLTFGEGKISYYEFGEGTNITLCFHGQSKSGLDYKPLAEIPNSKIFAINLPFHENTLIKPEKIDIVTLKEFFNKINTLFHTDKVNLIGFSLGGRFALRYVEFFPEKVKKLLLFNPDGFNRTDFYVLSANIAPLRWLYAANLEYPWFVKPYIAINKLSSLRHPKRIMFLENFFLDKEVRKLNYQTWRHLRHIYPNVRKIDRILNKHKLQGSVYMGDKDKVLSPKRMQRVIRGLSNFTYIEISAGHDVFKPKLLPKFVSIVKEEIHE